MTTSYDKKLAATKAWRERNKEHTLAKARQWKAEHKEQVKQARKAYYAANKEKENAQNKQWKEADTERYKISKSKSDAKYRTNNIEKITAYTKSSVVKARNNAKARERYHSDPVYRLMMLMRASLVQALRVSSVRKTKSIIQLLGCTGAELKVHIESQFLPGMSWERRSEIHIDHIKQVASFDLADPEQQKECFHYSNLRPLWAKDNLSRPKITRRK